MSRSHLARFGRALSPALLAALVIFSSARAVLATPHYFSYLPQYSAPGAQIVGGGINNSDTVAFQTTVGGVTTVYTAYGGHLTKIADSTQTDTFVNDNDMFNIHTVTSTFQNMRSVGVDDSGRAYFVTTLGGYYNRVEMSSEGTISHVFDFIPDANSAVAAYSDSGIVAATYDYGNTTLISNGVSTRISSASLGLAPNSPVVNNSGTLAGVLSVSAIAVSSGSSWSLGYSAYPQYIDWVAMNNVGSILFSPFDGTINRDALQILQGGSVSTVVGFDSPYKYFSSLSLNDSNSIAFMAYHDLIKGIYIGPNPETDKIVAVGDSFDGSTITDLSLFKKGLNNSGNVAFVATLADGRSGVYIAEPVPEPSSVVLAAVAALGCLGVRWRQRCRTRDRRIRRSMSLSATGAH